MPTANEQYFDLQVQHAERVEALKTGLVIASVAAFNRTEDDLRGLLYERVGSIEDRGFELQPKTLKKIENLTRDVYEQRAEVYTQLEIDLNEELESLAEYEAGFQQEAIERSLPFSVELSTPEKAALVGAVGIPFRGKTFNQWMVQLHETEISKFRTEITIGLQEGNDTDQIVRRVTGTKTNKYRDGILNLSRIDLEATVRTAVSHAVHAAKEILWKLNPAVSWVQYVAILDGRTTLRCISLDGQRFPVGVGPRPPQHHRCRSQAVGVYDAQSLIGDRTYVLDTRTPKARRVDFRRLAREEAGESVWRNMGPISRRRAIQRQRSIWVEQAIGKVPKVTTYRQWFDRQPEWYQKEKLGSSRFRLYKEGVSLDRLVDQKGHVYTLKELKDREREAFKAAFADKDKN